MGFKTRASVIVSGVPKFKRQEHAGGERVKAFSCLNKS